MANNNDAFVPELWANLGVNLLDGQLVMASLVNRDYEDSVQKFGDVVNTRQPSAFVARRKTKTDSVTIQDAQSTNIPIKLDQLFHTSFMIFDGEESLSFTSLVEEYMVPGISSMAVAANQAIVGEMYSFMDADSVGKLGTSVDADTVLAARNVLNKNKVLASGRRLVLPPNMETDLLAVPEYTKANEAADMGLALREGYLGQKSGFDIYLDNYMPSVATGNTLVTGLVNNAAGYSIGDTSITVDGFLAAIALGTWCTIAGDATPQLITNITGTTTNITISPGLRHAVVDNAVVTTIKAGAINYASDYAAGYEKDLTIDGFTVAPKQGQLASFGTTSALYGIMDGPDLSTTSAWLNKPLAAATVDNTVMGLGPSGDYGFAFHKNAISFINRPLALPMPGSGASAAIGTANGISLRVVISYAPERQGHLITLDMLCGVKVLDPSLGVVMFG